MPGQVMPATGPAGSVASVPSPAATAGWGHVGLWLHLRGRDAVLPPPDEDAVTQTPLTLLMHVAPDAETAAQHVIRRLSRARPDLRILRTGTDLLPDPAGDLAAARAALADTRAAVLVLMGSEMPAALIAAAIRQGLPVILGDARLDPRDATRWGLGRWGMEALTRRKLLQRIRRVLVSDRASHAIALRMGVDPARLTLTGPVTEIRDPLPCSEPERLALAAILAGRHAWFAAAVPPDEEDAVLTAHLAALRQSHRALLFLSPRDPGRIDALAEQIEASGLTVARRTLDEDPTEDVHVLITDGTTEMGLWYRLAPVSYLGGTLGGDDAAARHPFEPAGLGSAIVHGSAMGRHATEWQQLDSAGAARLVRTPVDLEKAIAELSQPDLMATLASNAWTVSTGGADVAMQITQPILEALQEMQG